MNKLLLKPSGINYTSYLPLPESVLSSIPKDKLECYNWMKTNFEQLQNRTDVVRHAFYSHKKKGYMISVWEMDGLYYLVLCIRTAAYTYKNTVYIDTELEQMKNIAKFIDKNNATIMSDYKSQILEARDALIKARIEEQIDTTGENNDA